MFTGFVAIFIFPTVKDGIVSFFQIQFYFFLHCHQIYISVHCQSVNYTEIPAIYTGQLCPSTRWLCSVIPQDICMPQVQPLLHLPLPS